MTQRSVATSAICVLTVLAMAAGAGAQTDKRIFGDIRTRGEAYDNLFDLDDKARTDDSAQFFLVRTRLGADARLAEDVHAYIRILNQYQAGNAQMGGADRTVTSVDNAFIELPGLGGLPLTLKLGRQDLSYGEGWIIKEGTPQDGPRSFGFDAVKLSYRPGDGKRVFDLLAAKTVEGDVGTADDSDLYGIYVTDNCPTPHRLEYYALCLNQNGDVVRRSGANASRRMPEKLVDTFGARLSGKATDQLCYATEWAKQYGTRRNVQNTDDVAIDAWAGYAHAEYSIGCPCSPTAEMGYWFFSGDGDGTAADGEYRGWDPIFAEYCFLGQYGRANKDLFDNLKGGSNAYNAVWGVPDNDPDYGMWTNMHMARAGVCFMPVKKLNCIVRYQHWLADKNNGPGGGSTRGGNWVAKVSYKLAADLTTFIHFEHFNPGDYYLASADDFWFARWQVLVQF